MTYCLLYHLLNQQRILQIFSPIWQRVDGALKFQIMLEGSHSIGFITQNAFTVQYSEYCSSRVQGCSRAGRCAACSLCYQVHQPRPARHRWSQDGSIPLHYLHSALSAILLHYPALQNYLYLVSIYSTLHTMRDTILGTWTFKFLSI